MATKKVTGEISFNKGGSVYNKKYEFVLDVPYPWKTGNMKSSFLKTAQEQKIEAPDMPGTTPHDVYNVEEA